MYSGGFYPYKTPEEYWAYWSRYILFLELDVGYNTPGIIKYPFWQMTAKNPKAIYAYVNLGESYAPKELADRSVCISGDIGEVLKKLK